MFVKICGIRSAADVDVAVGAGATALGFLVGLTHFSEDRLEPEAARRLMQSVPSDRHRVLVTHLTDPKAVADLVSHVEPTHVQLHGEMTNDQVHSVRALLPRAQLIRALHVGSNDTMSRLLIEASDLTPSVDAFLLDSRTDDRLGGTGQTHDWQLSRQVRESVNTPVLLAGGLSPDNVRDAVRAVRPAGVDVNSGVEAADGDKSPERCVAFVASARQSLSVDMPGQSL